MLTQYSSANASCSFQPCTTLNHHLLDDNGSMLVVSNFEYYILPGEHHVLYSGDSLAEESLVNLLFLSIRQKSVAN